MKIKIVIHQAVAQPTFAIAGADDFQIVMAALDPAIDAMAGTSPYPRRPRPRAAGQVMAA